MSENFSVATDSLRIHATTVGQCGNRVAYAAEAAQYLSFLDDGYGLFGKPLAMMLQVLQATHTTALGAAASTLDETVAKLGTCADRFDEVDNQRVKDLDDKAVAVEPGA